MTPRVGDRARGVFTAAFVTGFWNGLVVFLPILVCVIAVWWLAGRVEPVNVVVRFAGAAWLLGHDVPLGIGTGGLGLPPLLLTGAVCWRLTRAGAHTVRAIGGRDFAAVRAVTLAVTLAYTSVVTTAAFLVDSDVISVPVWRAAVHAAVLAAVFGSLGALSESGTGTVWWHRMPVWTRRGLRAGALATVLLLSVGALTAGVGIAVRGATVAEITDGFGAAGIGVGLLCLLYVPTMAVWSVAYLVGPGFAIGAGTSVRLVEVELGAVLPPFPLLGAVPTGPLDAWGTLLLGVPAAVGMFYGVAVGLRSRDLRIPQLLWTAVAAGVAVFGLLTALLAVSHGAVGGMAAVGPVVLETAGTAAVEVAVAVLLGSVLIRLFARREPE